MRNPIPNNRLVAFTLVGALLTMLVAGGLAFPGLGLETISESPSDAIGEADLSGAVSDEAPAPNTADDAPEPNENFTPDVQQTSSYEEYEEYEEHEEHEEYEEEEEYEEHEEYEDEEHEEEEYE